MVREVEIIFSAILIVSLSLKFFTRIQLVSNSIFNDKSNFPWYVHLYTHTHTRKERKRDRSKIPNRNFHICQFHFGNALDSHRILSKWFDRITLVIYVFIGVCLIRSRCRKYLKIWNCQDFQSVMYASWIFNENVTMFTSRRKQFCMQTHNCTIYWHSTRKLQFSCSCNNHRHHNYYSHTSNNNNSCKNNFHSK